MRFPPLRGPYSRFGGGTVFEESHWLKSARRVRGAMRKFESIIELAFNYGYNVDEDKLQLIYLFNFL